VVTVLKVVVPGTTVNPHPGVAVISLVCEQRGCGALFGIEHRGWSAETGSVRYWRSMRMEKVILERERIWEIDWVESLMRGGFERGSGCEL
jgi:hypothetical protein